MRKIFYYRNLVANRLNLTADESIVYSYLVYRCICECEDAWDKETGKFDDVAISYYSEEIEIPTSLKNIRNDLIHVSRIAEELDMNKSTISRCIKRLIELGYIDRGQENIKHNELYSQGYFELKYDSKLNGALLIFFSWLLDLRKDKPAIYANRNKLSSMFHEPLSHIREYLYRLNKLGLIGRDKNGALLLNY